MKNVQLLLNTLESLAQISIIHYRAHTAQRNKCSKGNNFADRAVKGGIKTWQASGLLQKLHF